MNKKLLPIIIVFLVIVLVFGKNVIFPTYTKNNSIYTRDILGRTTGQTTINYSPSRYTPLPSDNDPRIEFDLTKAKVGDKIGMLTITNIQSGKINFVSFSGRLTLTGKVYDNPEWNSGEIVCITNLDNASLAELPKIISDDRGIGEICFTNLQNAKVIFKDSEKTKDATVIIDNYKINDGYFIGALSDTATFISEVK